MDTFWIDFAFSILFTLLRSLIKNPADRETMKKVFLKIFKLIGQAYADDPDFELQSLRTALASITPPDGVAPEVLKKPAVKQDPGSDFVVG